MTGSHHVPLIISPENVLQVLEAVIYKIEIYNRHTVREAVLTYLLANEATAHGIKMMLSGEGAKEIFGKYHESSSSYEGTFSKLINTLVLIVAGRFFIGINKCR